MTKILLSEMVEIKLSYNKAEFVPCAKTNGKYVQWARQWWVYSLAVLSDVIEQTGSCEFWWRV